MRRILLLLCLALAALGAGAQTPAREQFQRSTLEFRTDFRGVLHGFQLSFRLETAMWVLLGEPVQDIAVTWRWNEGPSLDALELGRSGGQAVTVGDLRRQRPDLYRRFLALVPTRLEVPVEALFLDSTDERFPFAHLKKTLVPDLLGPAGKPAPLHVPGSSSWARFFDPPSAGWRGTTGIAQGTHQALQHLVDGPGSADPAAFNKTLYGLARRIRLRLPGDVTVLRLAWPEAELRALAEAFAQPVQVQEAPKGPLQSLLLLIDVSGSMNDEGRLPAAKTAATRAAREAIASGGEVAVLAFSGEDASPIRGMCPLTQEPAQAEAFIQTLQAGGGTPLAAALREANRYLARAKAPASRTQMIILLADGDGTGDVAATLASLKREGISFRHETIGLGVPAGGVAARQLQAISRTTGGAYHPAGSAAEVSRAFEDAVAAQKLMDLVGTFGEPAQPKPQAPASGMEDLLKTW